MFDSGDTSLTVLSSSRSSVIRTRGASDDTRMIELPRRSSFSSADSLDRLDKSALDRPMSVSPSSVRPVRPATWDRLEIWPSLT